jgi:hypothetical protein
VPGIAGTFESDFAKLTSVLAPFFGCLKPPGVEEVANSAIEGNQASGNHPVPLKATHYAIERYTILGTVEC